MHPRQPAPMCISLVTDGKSTGGGRLQWRAAGAVPRGPGRGGDAGAHWTSDGTFVATEVLAKHDEKYMPPEVVDALKRSGRWKEGEGGT